MDRKIISDIISNSDNTFDLTCEKDQNKLLLLADKLISFEHISISEFNNFVDAESAPLMFRLAVKLVESRRLILNISTPLSVGVVFAMWGEHHRLNKKSKHNPNGENSLLTKIDQLNWITKGTNVSWTLYPVDDGCPHGSYTIAKKMVSQLSSESQIHIMKLSDAIPTTEGPLKNLVDVNDSKKGGAIILGCQKALEDGVDCVVYTDADNSVHLGQIGLLLAPYAEKKAEVVLGNRKHKDSILVKQEERWGVGIKTLRHMQRMIGVQIFSQGIKDTQAAFKLYGQDALSDILKAPTVYDFSFDTDWILAAMEKNKSITTVPFAFIDSAEESASITQGPMTTWYTLLGGLVKAVRARNALHSNEMAAVFDKEVKSHKDLELIINTLPPELVNAEDHQLGDPNIMSPKALQRWFDKEKSKQAVV
ncbi:glycosyltransferase [Aliivibrio fischeri]